MMIGTIFFWVFVAFALVTLWKRIGTLRVVAADGSTLRVERT